MFQIDPMSREPVYEQIIQQVQQFILRDVLLPGSQIPSVRSVSEAVGERKREDEGSDRTADSAGDGRRNKRRDHCLCGTGVS